MNIDHYDGPVAMTTVTAPGRDVLEHEDHGDVEQHTAWSWNASATPRWSKLHRAAAARTRRRYGRWSPLAYEWEFQRRGVLHKHVVLPMRTLRDRHAAHCYVEALTELAPRHGFGYVDRGRQKNGRRTLESIPAGAAARYLAKYLAPLENGGKVSISETVKRPDSPSHLSHVSRDLTAATRCTMRTLRLRRVAWVAAQLLGAPEHVEDFYDWALDGVNVLQLVPAGKASLPPPV